MNSSGTARDAGSLEWASRGVRCFASATNLLVAGRRFAVSGVGERAESLRRLLTDLGARETVVEEADYLFSAGEGVAPFDLGGMPHRESPLVIVDLGADIPAAAVPGALAVARPGVFGVGPNVFLVSDAALEGPDAGRQRIDWARRFMPVSAALAAELVHDRVLGGLRIGVSMVLEPKTAVLALLLRDAGAEVSVYAHADETDDVVAEALRAEGIPVFARSTASEAEQRELALAFLDLAPQILVDDGSHVIRLAHLERLELLEGMIGAAEETTSGLRPLRFMHEEGALRIPVVAVNDARSKTLFDNLYGTGQSCIFAILDLLDGVPSWQGMSGKTVVVAGFGHVGQGVAHHAAALGATVVVAEVDPVRALQAVFAGHRVEPLVEAVANADLVISATGVPNTIGLGVLRACAPGAVVAVAGGVPQEIAIDDAVRAGAERATIRPKVERFAFPDGPADGVLILDDGGCINITAGEGNPIEIMDLSFAVQLGAIRLLAERGRELAPGLHPIPADLDDRVAEIALHRLGHRIDPVTARKQESASAWSVTRFTAGGSPA